MRLFAGAVAGVVIGGTVWIFGVSESHLGVRILLECVGAGVMIAASIETETEGHGTGSVSELEA
jgi:hypothetical protein